MINKIFYTLIFLLCFVFSAYGVTYDAYFSNSSQGNATGTGTPASTSDCNGSDAANTCTTLAHALAYINLEAITSGDTVRLWFDGGDEWEMDTGSVATTLDYGLVVTDSNPIVEIGSYGTGKAIFDGLVDETDTDWSEENDIDSTNGPLPWNRMFTIYKNGCKIDNVVIRNGYGLAVAMGGTDDEADNFTFTNNEVYNMGFGGLLASETDAIQGLTFQYNDLHDIGQQYYYDKLEILATGTVTDTGNETATLIDSGASFTSALNGHLVVNLTDNRSFCEVASVTSSSELVCVAPLQDSYGNPGDEFNNGDSYKIINYTPTWGIAVSTSPWNFPETSAPFRGPCDAAGDDYSYTNTISYNKFYNISGEVIHGMGYLAEYNIIGDSGSVGIYAYGNKTPFCDTVIRYNQVLMQGPGVTDYDDFDCTLYRCPKISGNNPSNDGIYIVDEQILSEVPAEMEDNSNAIIKVYGNLIVNRRQGITAANFHDADLIGAIQIYNNTTIDSITSNYSIWNDTVTDAGYFYNNLSVLYDQKTDSFHTKDSGVTNWTFSHNLYWSAGWSTTYFDGSKIDNDWEADCEDTYGTLNDCVGNPILAGRDAIDWGNLEWTADDPTDPTNTHDELDWDMASPDSGYTGAGIDVGENMNDPIQIGGLFWNDDFFTSAASFVALPSGGTFTRTDQDDEGSGWDIGAVVDSSSTTYNYYFSASGKNGSVIGDCTSSSSPCTYMTDNEVRCGGSCSGVTAQDCIDAAASDDIVNLFFYRGGTWTMDTDAETTTTTYGLTVSASGPTVNINWYGTSGAKPKFSGTVSNFANVPCHDPNFTTPTYPVLGDFCKAALVDVGGNCNGVGTCDGGGPFKWNTIFTILKDGCSIKNIWIDGIYGQGITLGSDSRGVDDIVIEDCDITNFGNAAIRGGGGYAIQDSRILNNLVHTGTQLEVEGKWPAINWPGAIMIAPLNSARSPSGNTISGNKVYDCGGEGIHAFGAIIEKNIVGDTGSVGIYIPPYHYDATDTVVRYNLVTFSNTANSIYDDLVEVAHDGIGIADEASGGSNSNATVEVYGNTVINRWKGIFVAAYNSTSPWEEIRIYNNTIIDSGQWNIAITEPGHDMVGVGKGYIYNNASILYDRSGDKHADDWLDPSDLIYNGSTGYWTIDNNAFWTTGGSPSVDNDWDTNYETGDPKLTTTSGYSLGATGDPSGVFDVDDITYDTGSSLFLGTNLSSIGFYDYLLNTNARFSELPTTDNLTANIQQLLSGWPIGAIQIDYPVYTAYFDPNGVNTPTLPIYNNNCTIANPCSTLTQAQQIIDSLSVVNTLNIYFKRGEIWDLGNTATSTTQVWGLLVESDDPKVNINWYGSSGNKPEFNGQVTDFSTTNYHNTSSGPLRWSRVFDIGRDGCSIKNIKINEVYGRGIRIVSADNIVIEGCDITNFGTSGIQTDSDVTNNSLFTNNLIHTGGQLSRYSALLDEPFDGACDGVNGHCWTNAIVFAPSTLTSPPSGNTVSYNVIYDMWGEGIAGTGFTAEYNVIGDTASEGIFVNPKSYTPVDSTIIRYNLLTQSTSSAYTQTVSPSSGTCNGIVVRDDNSGGSNTQNVEVYGNIVIHKRIGIQFGQTASSNPYWTSVKIYNNTVIDSTHTNILMYSPQRVVAGYIYNNASILYGETGSDHVYDNVTGNMADYWTIGYNAYWTAGVGDPTIEDNWDNNEVVGDPSLTTTTGYNSISASNPTAIGASDVYPSSDNSSLVNSGYTHGYETSFLTTGTDFSGLPDTEAFVEVDQTDYGAYDIGALIKQTGGSLHTVCASGCTFSTIAGVNGHDFDSGDIISFKKGESFTDANLTLAGITSPSGKSITINSYGTSSTLPVIGYNSTYIAITLSGINLTIRNINIDGQDFTGDVPKLLIQYANNVILDGVYADGSIGYNTACTPDSDCSEKRGIWIAETTGTVEITNCTIKNWGGDEDIWNIPSPAGTGSDRSCLTISGYDPTYGAITTGYFSIHDNTITNCESDGIIIEDLQSSSTSSIFDNTINNCGENSVDIKASKNIDVYHNTFYRDSSWTGLGGDSYGETEGLYKQGLIQVITRPGSYDSSYVDIYENLIGPSDGAGIGVRGLESGHSVTNVNVYRNYVQNTLRNLYTTQVTGSSISNIVFQYNVLDGMQDDGTHIWDDDEDAVVSSLFYNNTIYINDTGYSTYSNLGYIYLKDSDASFINNIFQVNDSNDYILYVDSGSNPTINHNTYYNADSGDDTIIYYKGSTFTESSTDLDTWDNSHTGAKFINPILVSPSTDDFSLNPNSPCIDTGVSLVSAYSIGFDWDNTTWSPIHVETLSQNSFGTGWEIGAAISTSSIPHQGNLIFTPNASGNLTFGPNAAGNLSITGYTD